MSQALERRHPAHHPEPRFEEGLIVRLPVVRHQNVEFRQVPVEGVQEAGLLAEVPHEELADAKTVRRDPSHAHQECVRP